MRPHPESVCWCLHLYSDHCKTCPDTHCCAPECNCMEFKENDSQSMRAWQERTI